MNQKLQKYLEEEIMLRNNLNDEGHNIEHVNYVRRRSQKFANMVGGLNLYMVDTIAVYHNVGIVSMLKTMKKYLRKFYLKMKNCENFF